MRTMYEYHIGNTPLIKMENINRNQVYIKAESYNFLGSIKARTGYYMIKDLPVEAEGKTLVESTSGNLGLSLGFFCKETKRTFLALTDPSIASFKREQMERFGITCVEVDAEPGLDYRSSRIRMAEEMVASGDYFWVNQYHNSAAIKAHEDTTAPEIWEQTNHKVTHVVCPMGSCGTICGLGRFFHKRNLGVKVIGVEPFGSTIYGSFHGNYINVGAGLVGKPGNLIDNPDTVDATFVVNDYDSINSARALWSDCHIDAGVTTGMVYVATQRLAAMLHDCCIVAISADGRGAYSEYL